MRLFPLFLTSLSLLAGPGGAIARWPLAAERLMAADAASFAPPDFKRQLVNHRDRLMAGVTDAAAAETGKRDAAQHRAAAARAARIVATRIREHHRFDEIAYEMGGIVHEVAAATVPPVKAGALADVARSANFLGFAAEPFRRAGSAGRCVAPLETPRAAYDASVTLNTRLAAWIWKTAGGDATITRQFPESRGPYLVRD